MERDGLVGRERELETLDQLVGSACAGRGGATVVLGEAGIGKTAVVEALAGRAAERGAVVVWGRCTEADAPVFWPWRQAFGALDAFGSSGLDVLDAGSAVSRPELFARVLDRLAARTGPVVLVLEDLHWADEASTALLRFVVDALPTLPMALVATARDVNVAPGFGEWLGSLPPAVERLKLTGLDPRAIAELVTGVLGYQPPPEATDRIAQRSGGNPFFAREVAQLHALRGSAATVAVPAAVQQVLERRLAQLDPSCVELIECAAVAGRPDPEIVAAVVRRSSKEVLDGFGPAVSAGLLVADRTDLDFAHDLVREVAYQRIYVADRPGLHRGVAEALTALDPEGCVGEIASHWRQVGIGVRAQRQVGTGSRAHQQAGAGARIHQQAGTGKGTRRQAGTGVGTGGAHASAGGRLGTGRRSCCASARWLRAGGPVLRLGLGDPRRGPAGDRHRVGRDPAPRRGVHRRARHPRLRDQRGPPRRAPPRHPEGGAGGWPGRVRGRHVRPRDGRRPR